MISPPGEIMVKLHGDMISPPGAIVRGHDKELFSGRLDRDNAGH
jgi:hypothetical protein